MVVGAWPYTGGMETTPSHVIAITGARGKTCVACMLRTILDGDEAYVNRIGDAVVLTPKKSDMLASMLAAADLFTDDFMEGVEDLPLQERGAAL